MNIQTMLSSAAIVTGVILGISATPASAYSLQKPNGQACTKDGSECQVYCDNKQLAGSMYWNGTVWTDGVKWDPDQDTEARKITAANGSACT
jgi:hypothetical protein